MALDRSKKTTKIVVVTHEMANEIQDFRFNRRFKTDSSALRTILRAGLDTLNRQGEGDGGPASLDAETDSETEVKLAA